MIKTVLSVDGMACGMCEAHINDKIRSELPVKKVTSSYRKNSVEIISDEVLPEDSIRRVIEATGYKLLSVSNEPYVKRSFFGLF